MPSSIEQHYSREDIVGTIREALRRAGKDPQRLTADDLSPVDEFHVRGRLATEELAQLAGLRAGMHVLDLGCGIGGPSRYLAAHCGCRVTGIDLTTEYCRVCREIAQWVGLQDRVDYHPADALKTPFPEATFDAAWTQHAAMNIRSKDQMYREVRRVLRPGGVFALNDFLRGAQGEVIFPVPWARDPSLSFLVSVAELRRLLTEAGFEVAHESDVTQLSLEWIRHTIERFRTAAPPPLSPQLLMGPEFLGMVENVARSLEAGSLEVWQVVARRD